MSLRPSAAAIERIATVGETEFLAFLDEISPKGAREVANILPTIPGFRKSSESGLRQRKRKLAQDFLSNRNLGPLNRARADRAFCAFWRAWALEKLGEPVETAALLDAINDSFKQGEQDNPDFTEAVLHLFSALKARSFENKCSREDIERLLLFSPLDETREIRRLIESAKSAAEVERDTAVAELPERLRRDEEEVKSLEARLASITTQVATASATVAKTSDELGPIRRSISGLAAELRQVRTTTESSVAGLRQEIATLAQNTDARIAKLSADVEQFNEMLSHLERESSSSRLALESRLDSLKRAVEERASTVPSRSTTARSDEGVTLRVRALIASSAGPVSTLKSYDDASAHLAAALEDVGLKKVAARTLSREVCTAVVLGQVIFFKGAMSTELVRLCATVFAGANAFRVPIPVGLMDGEPLREELQSLDRGHIDRVCAIALEGINRSALDVLADVLSDLVTSTALGSCIDGSWLVFAGVEDGLATLVPDLRYAELGPIFDVDCLDWRLRRTSTDSIEPGEMTVEMFRSVRAKLASHSADTEEATRLVRHFSRYRNPRIETTIVAAYIGLEVTSQPESLSAMQSLAYGWLLPLALANGLSGEDVDSELDGGKCDAAVADARIVSLLSGPAFRADKEAI